MSVSDVIILLGMAGLYTAIKRRERAREDTNKLALVLLFLAVVLLWDIGLRYM
jgi:hypothetical protein